MSKEKVYGMLMIGRNIGLFETKDLSWIYDSSSQTVNLEYQNVPDAPTVTYVTGSDAESIAELLGSLQTSESPKNGLKSDDFALARKYLQEADINELGK